MPTDSKEKFTLKYFVVSETSLSSVNVAKTVIVPDNSVSVIKGRLSNFANFNKMKDSNNTYVLMRDGDGNIEVPNVLLSDIGNRTMKFAVENNSGESIKLKKGEKLTNIFTACEVEEEPVTLIATSEMKDETASNNGHLSSEEQDWLRKTVEMYNEEMSKFPKDIPPKIPIQHKIELKDCEPVYTNPHRLPLILKKEVDSQVQNGLS